MFMLKPLNFISSLNCVNSVNSLNCVNSINYVIFVNYLSLDKRQWASQVEGQTTLRNVVDLERK